MLVARIDVAGMPAPACRDKAEAGRGHDFAAALQPGNAARTGPRAGGPRTAGLIAGARGSIPSR
jgi:hypothetical protein